MNDGVIQCETNNRDIYREKDSTYNSYYYSSSNRIVDSVSYDKLIESKNNRLFVELESGSQFELKGSRYYDGTEYGKENDN